MVSLFYSACHDELDYTISLRFPRLDGPVNSIYMEG